MKKILILFFVVMGALIAKAQDGSSAEQDIEDSYTMQCGSIEDVLKLAKIDIKDLTDEDRKELSESRKSSMSVIRGGAPVIQKLLDQGSKNGTGGFGVLLVCGTINQISDKIKTRGCIDLAKNEVIKDGPGIEACKKVMARLK